MKDNYCDYVTDRGDGDYEYCFEPALPNQGQCKEHWLKVQAEEALWRERVAFNAE